MGSTTYVNSLIFYHHITPADFCILFKIILQVFFHIKQIKQSKLAFFQANVHILDTFLKKSGDIYIINSLNILFCQSLLSCKVSAAANCSAHSFLPISTTYMWNIRRVHQGFIHRWRFISDICWCGINILQQSFLHLPKGALCLFSELQDSTQFCGRSLSGGDMYKTLFNFLVKGHQSFFANWGSGERLLSRLKE